MNKKELIKKSIKENLYNDEMILSNILEDKEKTESKEEQRVIYISEFNNKSTNKISGASFNAKIRLISVWAMVFILLGVFSFAGYKLTLEKELYNGFLPGYSKKGTRKFIKNFNILEEYINNTCQIESGILKIRSVNSEDIEIVEMFEKYEDTYNFEHYKGLVTSSVNYTYKYYKGKLYYCVNPNSSEEPEWIEIEESIILGDYYGEDEYRFYSAYEKNVKSIFSLILKGNYNNYNDIYNIKVYKDSGDVVCETYSENMFCLYRISEENTIKSLNIYYRQGAIDEVFYFEPANINIEEPVIYSDKGHLLKSYEETDMDNDGITDKISVYRLTHYLDDEDFYNIEINLSNGNIINIPAKEIYHNNIYVQTMSLLNDNSNQIVLFVCNKDNKGGKYYIIGNTEENPNVYKQYKTPIPDLGREFVITTELKDENYLQILYSDKNNAKKNIGQINLKEFFNEIEDIDYENEFIELKDSLYFESSYMWCKAEQMKNSNIKMYLPFFYFPNFVWEGPSINAGYVALELRYNELGEYDIIDASFMEELPE